MTLMATLLFLILAGCAPEPYYPTQEPGGWPPTAENRAFAQQQELMRMQAAGMILQGMAQRGGIVHPPQAIPYNYHLAPMVPLAPVAPAWNPPPSNCLLQTSGGSLFQYCN